MSYERNGDEPVLEVELGNDTEQLHRWNTTHYTFLGELSCYDHVFIVLKNTPDEQSGWYMFRTGEKYDETVQFIQDNDLPQHLHMTEVGRMDFEAWQSHYMGEDIDAVPEEWSNENS